MNKTINMPGNMRNVTVECQYEASRSRIFNSLNSQPITCCSSVDIEGSDMVSTATQKSSISSCTPFASALQWDYPPLSWFRKGSIKSSSSTLLSLWPVWRQAQASSRYMHKFSLSSSMYQRCLLQYFVRRTTLEVLGIWNA